MSGRGLRPLGLVRSFVGSVLDFFVKYVPDVAPIVFDAERSARWARMVDDATVVHVGQGDKAA